LGALSLHIQLLKEKLDDVTPPGVGTHLRVLKDEIGRIGDVLESFRDFASANKLNLRPTDLRIVVKRAIGLIRPQLGERDITLRTELSPEEGVTADVDGSRLEQVILNLFLNSVQAMEDGGLLTVQLTQNHGFASFEISDTGAGIPENVLSRVFDPYFTTKPQGLGMGLAVCRKIVEQHGGTIACETRPEGAVFRVRIPLASGRAAAQDNWDDK
jgi:two-component system nitrogen regulation sensor histidine kinase GlnL